jgi:hypothetical protein
VLDPKRHYRANDSAKIPKFFQLATVVSNAADYHAKEGNPRHAKRTLVQELMSDADFRRYNKSKYIGLQQDRMKNGRKSKSGAGKK